MRFGHNLESIDITCVRGLTNEYLAEILQQNPKMKIIDLKMCQRINTDALQTIVNCAPQLRRIARALCEKEVSSVKHYSRHSVHCNSATQCSITTLNYKFPCKSCVCVCIN